MVLNPLHYLALLEKKPGALEQAAPLQEWALSAAFERLRRLLEARIDKRRRKEYIQILLLLETFGIGQVDLFHRSGSSPELGSHQSSGDAGNYLSLPRHPALVRQAGIGGCV